MADAKQRLLRQLHSPSAQVRAQATQQLWELWYAAAGPAAEQRLRQAEALLESQAYDEAEAALGDLIREFPDFAEARNRRATLRYLRRQYADSLEDCAVVVRLEPDHFGAWHGMGLCLLSLHRYGEAAAAFRRALEVQPFAQANHDLLLSCLAKLN